MNKTETFHRLHHGKEPLVEAEAGGLGYAAEGWGEGF